MAERTDNRTSDNAADGKPLSAARVIRAAADQLADLLGLQAEAVSSCTRTEDGSWRLSVEVLELARIPDTMSLLASYDVEVDANGDLTGYRRTRRYERGRADRT
ncbi:hypothetical protein SUDANB120_05970 [Streptomyces sp. enrichment culture]|uniref:Gas vesicle protein GvpO n=1 Tax=Streptomyces toxytricini TaxID=67369 RepID=A0ABW8EFQ8_STRT5|nr:MULTISPECIES: gas vesicle protein GvpO [Streptomyces]MBD3577648.1 gas vesicle protein [Streptomyces sp. KD18]GGT09280.1 hypothetical protein GCM10010286_38390 [Streptomyces toxytricini]